MTPTTKIVPSKDGTDIFAQAVGDPTKPHVVFVHGFCLGSIVFDRLFEDSVYVAELYMVNDPFLLEPLKL